MEACLIRVRLSFSSNPQPPPHAAEPTSCNLKWAPEPARLLPTCRPPMFITALWSDLYFSRHDCHPLDLVAVQTGETRARRPRRPHLIAALLLPLRQLSSTKAARRKLSSGGYGGLVRKQQFTQLHFSPLLSDQLCPKTPRSFLKGSFNIKNQRLPLCNQALKCKHPRQYDHRKHGRNKWLCEIAAGRQIFLALMSAACSSDSEKQSGEGK